MTSHSLAPNSLHISPTVAAAQTANLPIVALESTVYSTLGLPSPQNAQVLQATLNDLDALGVTPALTAVIDGVCRIGVEPADHAAILSAEAKVAARDLAVAIGQRWPTGVTTVGASLVLANAAGLDVFATGGIGGVHRDYTSSGDASGDLAMIARFPIATVCAGAKAFLDLPRTLERLETLGVPVLGFGTDEFPAFTAATSGLPVPHRCDDAAEVAAILMARRDLGQGGVLVCVPPPAPIDQDVLDTANAQAEAAAEAAGITGPKRTPFILGHIAESTDGASVAANLALVRNNARVAAEIATALVQALGSG